MAEQRVLYIGGGATPARHNYVGKLLAMLARGELVAEPGEFLEVDVYHDAWCPALSGGTCTCEPDIRVRGDPAMN